MNNKRRSSLYSMGISYKIPKDLINMDDLKKLVQSLNIDYDKNIYERKNFIYIYVIKNDDVQFYDKYFEEYKICILFEQAKQTKGGIAYGISNTTKQLYAYQVKRGLGNILLKQDFKYLQDVFALQYDMVKDNLYLSYPFKDGSFYKNDKVLEIMKNDIKVAVCYENLMLRLTLMAQNSNRKYSNPINALLYNKKEHDTKRED